MFRLICFVGLLFLLSPATNAVNLLSGPEGVVYDSVYSRWLVSNWFGGSIVQIEPDGTQSFFRTGLDHPSGIHIKDSIVYASCNNQVMVGLDLISGSTVFSKTLSTSGLHGIATDTSGYLYACDWNRGRVLRIDRATGDDTVFVFGIAHASGIVFDAAQNRMIVCSWGGNRDIKAIALPGGEVTTIITAPFADLDDIQRDQFGNYYVATWNESPAVYRFDSIFSLPPEPICDGFGPMTDCFYNRQDNLLAVTSYSTNSYWFVQRVIVVDPAATWGWVPYDVDFQGSSDFSVDTWWWDFGDGDTAYVSAPTHIYTDPGIYDVQMNIVTSQGDTLTRNVPNCVVALADTLWADQVEILTDSSLDVVIHGTNTIALSSLIIPIEFSGGDLDLSASISYTTEGCRTEGLDYQNIVHMIPSKKQMTFHFKNTGYYSDIAPGSGPVLKIHFEPESTPQVGQSATISVSGYGTRLPTFSGMLAEYMPVAVDGSISITINCCEGFRGNIDGDEWDRIIIADLVYLVAYMFNQGPEPECFGESDVDGSYVKPIDIADLVYLVDYLYNGGPDPPMCP